MKKFTTLSSILNVTIISKHTKCNIIVLIKSIFFFIFFFSFFILHGQSVFTVDGTKIKSPNGTPIKLCGWRIDFNSWSKIEGLSQSNIEYWNNNGLLGNAQAVEIWWSRESTGTKKSPSEFSPHRPGQYDQDGMKNLLQVLRNIARSGSYIIPSIRVSYDQEFSLANTKKGINTWQGWANHRKLIYNDPVVVEEGPNAGTYGRHRDRFFAWLDWIMPQILADKEISDKIAYWEMWHYYGHKHGSSIADRDHYLDDFIPRLIAKYREHDPHRLLGVGVTSDAVVHRLNTRLDEGTWKSYTDKNWIFVTGGYGILGIIMRPDFAPKTPKIWPLDSGNPTYLRATSEFNVEKVIRIWQTRPYYSCFFENGNVPPHPALFVKKRVYEIEGFFNLDYKLAADYEFMLRIFKKHNFESMYINKVITKMRLGGATNSSFISIINQNREILLAWKNNGFKSPLLLMPIRLIKRVIQFF
jgi:hypothetical protein